MKHVVFLIIIAHMDFGAQSDRAAVGRFQAIDDFQKGRFSCSVIADDGDAFPTLNIMKTS